MAECCDYIKSVVPGPEDITTILQLPLKRFCLGHYFIFARWENRLFSKDSKVITEGDLLFALGVCARKFEDGVEWTKDIEGVNKWCANYYKTVVAIYKQHVKE